MLKNYDAIIIGGGAAGLYTALNLNSNLNILVLCKKALTLSNSALAQGGIAAVFDKESDNIALHIQDSLIAGEHKNNPKTLEVLVSKGPSDVQTLIEYGVDFDKSPDGSVHLTLEGGHSRHRILHYKDSTGREIVDKLIIQAKMKKNITILENTIVCDMKGNGTGFTIDTLKQGQHLYYTSKYCVIATGGIGRVFEYTTNSAIATGDGITLAYHMGATVKNLSLVQFHPTAFSNAHTRECFLISEAVRGEGAYLLNHKYERFMEKYDKRLELAPRNVVSKAIINEARKTGSEQFYLDISHKGSEFIQNRFPMIYKNLKQEGYDLTTDKIPIFPCQHYLMGGIDVDEHSRTTIPNLYAVGECAHTGVHGNNRLASNSLLEAVVFAHQAADDINAKFDQISEPVIPCEFELDENTQPLPTGIRTEIRSIMQRSHFVIPDKTAAYEGFERVLQLKKMVECCHFDVTADYIEAKSLITIAYLILKEVLN